MTHDPVFKKIVGTPALASQPSLSRFYTRFDKHSIEYLNQANQELLDKIHLARQSKSLFINLDSLIQIRMGIKNPRHIIPITGRWVFIHWSLLMGRLATLAQLRPGNVYTSNGVVEFIQPLIEHYNEIFPETTLFLRGDSGFAVPALNKE